MTAIYVAAARLGLQLSFTKSNVTPLWPPAGIALAVFLLYGYRYWPGILIGAFLSAASTGAPWGFSLSSAIGNTLESIIGAYLLQRVIQFDNVLERVRDVLGFFFLAALLSPVASATIGALALCLNGMLPWSAYISSWLIWWMGDVVGIIVVAPVILTWAMRPSINRSRKRYLEAFALFVALLITCSSVFAGWFRFEAMFPLVYIPLPLLVWAAFRFRQREVATANLLVALIAIWGTIRAADSLYAGLPGLTLICIFLSTISATSLFLTAVIAEIRQTARALQQSEERFRAAAEGSQDAFYILQSERDQQGRIADFSFVDLNQNGAKLIRLPRERIIGGRVSALFTLQQIENLVEKYARVAETGETLDEELVLCRSETDAGWLHHRVVPLADGVAVTIRDITERKRAEAELASSLALLRSTIESTGDGILVVSADNVVAMHNRRFATMWNLPEGWLKLPASLERLAFLLNQLSDLDAFFEQIEMLNGQPDAEGYDTLALKDGRIFEYYATPYRSGEGTAGRVWSFRDLTARKHVELALQESETKFRRFVEQTSDGIILTDEQGRITEWNRSQEQISGLKRSEVIGQMLWDIRFHQSPNTGSYEQVKAALVNFIQTGQADWANRGVELEIQRSDGTKRFILTTTFAIRTEKGFIAASVSRDITERKAAEEALRQSEAIAHKQRVLAEALRDTIAALTSTLDIDAVMHRILENVGRVVPHEGANIILIEGNEARVAHWWKIPPETEAFIRSHRFSLDTPSLREMLTTKTPLLITDTCSYPGWANLTVQSYVGAPLIVHGQIIGFLNLDSAKPGFFDAAAAENLQIFANQAAMAIENAQLYAASRRYAEELEKRVAERTAALTEANQKLLELDHLKSRFITDISHELRTPVAGMITSLYLMERDRPDRRSSHLISLKREAGRLKDLLEDILDFSRLEETSRQPSHFSPVDLNTLCTQVIEENRPRADTAGLTLKFTPLLDLPTVPGNPDYLVRVVVNLLANAISYTPAGQIEIKTYLSERRNQACLEVSDTGIGIAPEDLPHLFDRFYRGRRVGSSNIPGAGLGLNIVKGIVDLHNGQVEVESEVDKGSTFRVWLPLA